MDPCCDEARTFTLSSHPVGPKTVTERMLRKVDATARKSGFNFTDLIPSCCDTCGCDSVLTKMSMKTILRRGPETSTFINKMIYMCSSMFSLNVFRILLVP